MDSDLSMGNEWAIKRALLIDDFVFFPKAAEEAGPTVVAYRADLPLGGYVHVLCVDEEMARMMARRLAMWHGCDTRVMVQGKVLRAHSRHDTFS